MTNDTQTKQCSLCGSKINEYEQHAHNGSGKFVCWRCFERHNAQLIHAAEKLKPTETERIMNSHINIIVFLIVLLTISAFLNWYLILKLI